MRVNKYDQDEFVTSYNFKIFRLSLKFLKKYKRSLFITFTVSILGSILTYMVPKIVSYVVDKTIPAGNINLLVMLVSVAFIIGVLGIVIEIIKGRMINNIHESLSYDLKDELFKKLQYLSIDYFDTRPHGKILTRITSYADNISNVLCNDFIKTALDLINLIILTIFLLSCSVPLTFLILFFVSLVCYISIVVTPIKKKIKRVINSKSANVNAYLTESINGMDITKSFNRENKNEYIFNDLENSRVRETFRILKYNSVGWSLAGGFSVISLALVYIIALAFFYPEMSIGIIIAVGSYCSSFWDPVVRLTSIYGELIDFVTYLEQVFDLLDEPLTIENKKGAHKVDIKGKIEFDNVSFGYGAADVISDVSFTINPCENIAIVGETGAGKSTLISLIARYYDVNKGRILIDNENIKDIDLYSLRDQVNVMAQDNYVYSRSIFENITYGNNEITLEQVIHICKIMDIHDWINSLENGYNTVLHNNGKDISTGQRQLICFARTILADPKIIILDEATSNVDLRTELQIQKAIKLLLDDRTAIVIAHRLSTIVFCDRIFVVKNKKICEVGTHNELIAKKGEYYNLYTSQIKV
ncbi:MAG: ABC transporter ATP-binding protein [Bacilli bacterium]